MECCNMKGFLSFLIIWNLGKKDMTGAEIARDLEKRRGIKPSPGTLYPALKVLKEKGLIEADGKKVYSLTKKGREELREASMAFAKIFHDADDICSCCMPDSS